MTAVPPADPLSTSTAAGPDAQAALARRNACETCRLWPRKPGLVAIAVALLAIHACADRSAVEPERAFEAARQALWRGDLARAQTLIEHGSSLGQADPASPRSW